MATNQKELANSLEGKKVLCFFSNILGLRTLSTETRRVFEQYDVDARYVYVEPEDFVDRNIGFLQRFSNSYESICVARDVLKRESVSLEEFDVIFVISHQLAAALSAVPSQSRLVIMYDTTPKMAHRSNVLYQRNLASYLSSTFSRLLDLLFFNRLFKSADALLAMSERAKNSTINDYAVSERKLAIVYTPVDVCAPKSSVSDHPKILFVGNNIYRKGGDILMNVFMRHLSSTCELYIVSSDPSAADFSNVDSVTVIGWIPREELLKLYNTMDLFVLPTRRDDGGSALCEAIGCGLPAVVRNAGAQGDWVITGYNGSLMAYDSTEEDWAEELVQITSDRNLLLMYSANSIELAEMKLSRKHFQEAIMWAAFDET